MVDVKEEHFCRTHLLSTSGVTPVLEKVFLYIVNKTCNGDVDKFLKEFQNDIILLKKKKIITDTAYKLLFPTNGKTNTCKWDISLLTCILLNYCTLEGRCRKDKLINIIDQEVAASFKDLQSFLKANKSLIDQKAKKLLNEDQYKQIFPPSGQRINLTAWDFEVLLVVLAICSSGMRSELLKNLIKPYVIAEIALSQFNLDLTSYLKKHSKRLNNLREDRTISKDDYEQMFPVKAIDSDLNNWGQWLLAAVIIDVCPHLQASTIKAIDQIRRVRNENLAHISQIEMDEEEFKSLWSTLVKSIENVIENELTDYTFKEWKDTICHIRSGPLNKQQSLDILKERYKQDEHIEERIEELAVAQQQGFKDILDQNKKLMEQAVTHKQELEDTLQRISIQRHDVYSARVEIKCIDIRITLKGNDVKAVRRAEDIIRQAIEDEDNVALKDTAACKSLKEAITKQGSVIAEVLSGSIILKVRCHNLKELSYLFHYEGTMEMQMHLDELASVVGPVVGEEIEIHSCIPDSTLISTTEEVTRVCVEHGVEIMMLPGDIYLKEFQAAKIATHHIAYPEDKSICRITSCLALPSGCIVLCDSVNRNIKLLDDTFVGQDILKLKNKPCDSSLSLKNYTDVMVTVPDEMSVYVIGVDTDQNKWKKSRTFRVNGECHGITCCSDSIAVTVDSVGACELQLLTYDSLIVMQTIRIDTKLGIRVQYPEYMTTLVGGTRILIPDWENDSLILVNLKNGWIDIIYKDAGLEMPRSVTSDLKDNIYIVGWMSNNVRVIPKTGQKIGDILTSSNGLYRPKALHFNEFNNTLILQNSISKSEMCVYKVPDGLLR